MAAEMFPPWIFPFGFSSFVPVDTCIICVCGLRALWRNHAMSLVVQGWLRASPMSLQVTWSVQATVFFSKYRLLNVSLLGPVSLDALHALTPSWKATEHASMLGFWEDCEKETWNSYVNLNFPQLIWSQTSSFRERENAISQCEWFSYVI